jgi:hypothetical protein
MIADVFEGSCEHCHSVGFRVEYEKKGRKWIKNTICCICKQKALN